MAQGAGLFIVITGPTGVGKSTVAQELIQRNQQICKSISVTTRPLRDNEQEGVEYRFKSRQAFEEMIDRGAFIEYVLQFNTYYYGLERAQVEQMRNDGKDVILELDVDGAKRIRRSIPDAVFIYVLPPDITALRTRLESKQISEEERLQYMRRSCDYVGDAMNFRYVVTNDDARTCARRIESIIEAERYLSARNEEAIENLMRQCERS